MTSLNEAISGLEQKIASAYAALEENGVTVEGAKTLTNLPQVLSETAGFIRLKPISARVGKLYVSGNSNLGLYAKNGDRVLLLVYELKKTDKKNFLIVYPNLGNRFRTGLGNEFSTGYYDTDAPDITKVKDLLSFSALYDGPTEHLYTVWQASNVSNEYKFLYVYLSTENDDTAPMNGFEIYQF